jgi:hypothetical protein
MERKSEPATEKGAIIKRKEVTALPETEMIAITIVDPLSQARMSMINRRGVNIQQAAATSDDLWRKIGTIVIAMMPTATKNITIRDTETCGTMKGIITIDSLELMIGAQTRIGETIRLDMIGMQKKTKRKDAGQQRSLIDVSSSAVPKTWTEIVRREIVWSRAAVAMNKALGMASGMQLEPTI